MRHDNGLLTVYYLKVQDLLVSVVAFINRCQF